MKASRTGFFLGLVLSGLVSAAPASAAPTSAAPTSASAEPRLVLPDLTTLTKKASQQVTITLDSSMLVMAGKFLDADDPQDAAILDIIKGLSGIYVRSYTFDEDGAYRQSDIDAINNQLAAPGWNRLVQTKSRKTGANVDIYLLVAGNKATGMALIATEPRELTIVNIVGSIDLDKLHKLEGHLGVPKF
jgi:uncharacterized hydantoinase/oxoprolinase family protein